MITAIVYSSNTGHTKKYAELLAAKTGLSCNSLDEGATALGRGDEVIYLGWIKAGSINGLKTAALKFKLSAAVGVGITEPSEEYLANVKNVNRLGNIPCFYLRGGYDLTKLRGFNKMIFNLARSGEKKKGIELPDSEDFVSEENLAELLSWVEGNR